MVSPYYPNQVPWTDKKDWVSPENPGDLVEADHVNQLYAEVNAIGQDVGSHKSDNVTQGDEPHGVIYEEGTFTPVLVGSTVAGNHTYDWQEGQYVRQNNLVTIRLRLRLTDFDDSASGTLRLTGLPFSADGFNNAIAINSISNLEFGSNRTQISGRINTSAFIELFGIASGLSATTLLMSSCKDNTEFRISATYQIDQEG